jgi:2-methylcitrate dehydratase PrpD
VTATTRAPTASSDVVAFALGLRWRDIPPAVRTRLAWLLLDFAAVSVAGRPALAAQIAADYASEVCPGGAATALLDGRRLSVPGAAWANGVLANVLDYDDGHRLTKGHAGANVIPAALAAAEARDASLEDLLVAIAVGYEVAIRAGVHLHAREHEYHASGAWGAIGAAAAAGRHSGLGVSEMRHAIGVAEYHAPIAPVMRSVADPAMTKDATGWGAFLGSSSAELARAGYTALESIFLAGNGDPDLGQRWHLDDVYVKAYPCCRWTQPAIEGALEVRRHGSFAAEDIRGVTIRTFAAAEGLARGRPRNAEEAQYSLIWPVAMALVRGTFGVDEVLGAFDDAIVTVVAEGTTVAVDETMTEAFPDRRYAEVTVELADGAVLRSGIVEARGEPGDPGWETVVAEKVRRHLIATFETLELVDPPSAACRGRSLDELMTLLAYSAGRPT